MPLCYKFSPFDIIQYMINLYKYKKRKEFLIMDEEAQKEHLDGLKKLDENEASEAEKKTKEAKDKGEVPIPFIADRHMNFHDEYMNGIRFSLYIKQTA